MAMLSSVIAGETTTPQVANQACHATALQLLLRLMPFRQGGNKEGSGQLLQHNRHALLEELHKHPLWKYSSLDSSAVPRTPQRHVVPCEVHDSLVDYVRMAAEADHLQRPQTTNAFRRQGPVSASELAAELHAVYALAAVHAASQQQQQDSSSKANSGSQIGSAELFTLLTAYAALGEHSCNSSHDSSTRRAHRQYDRSSTSMTAGSGQDDSAAVVEALCALAALGDTASPGQQQPAPGQLSVRHSFPAASAAGKTPAVSSKQGPTASNSNTRQESQIATSNSKQEDLAVLLKLATLVAKS